jgi:protocatechuate 3,4-dioxygenase beta subunit
MTRHEHGNDLHDRGLAFDLATIMQRRRALMLLGGAAAGAAALVVVGCGDDDKTTPATATAPTGSGSGSPSAAATEVASGSTATVAAIPAGATPASACTGAVPSETGGPFPGDGSNGPNVLTQSGILRSDIRSSFGTSSTVAQGVPLSVVLTIVDTKNSCKPLPGAAVYAWHCDINGNYSLYSQGVTNENYLRGVQVADANGVLTFKSVFPGCYSGRWPHIHFEVYPSLDAANSSRNALVTSQLALPEDICKAVYATTGYSQSVTNLARVSLKSDNVFSNGWDLQMPTVTGSVANGLTAALLVGV